MGLLINILPASANVFLCSFGNEWIRICTDDFELISANNMVMTYLFFFLLLFMQKSLISICHISILT